MSTVLFFSNINLIPTTASVAKVSSISIVANSTLQSILLNINTSWPWYITRGAGLVAACLLILLMLSGIGQITGFTYRIFAPLTAWKLHRALGIALGVTILVHALPLLVDTFVPFNILQILVPFASPYSPFVIFGVSIGSVGVALGVLSGYVAAAVLLSSLYWIDKKPFWWRLLHYLSYLLIIMVIFHGLLVGTDLKTGILRTLWLLAGSVIILAIFSRMWRARTTSLNQAKEDNHQ